MASIIRSDAAALGHQTRCCRPGTFDRLDHQTLVVRPARTQDRQLATGSGVSSQWSFVYVLAAPLVGRPAAIPAAILDALQLLFLFIYDRPGGSNILEQLCH